jgi:hypothetical protein
LHDRPGKYLARLNERKQALLTAHFHRQPRGGDGLGLGGAQALGQTFLEIFE